MAEQTQGKSRFAFIADRIREINDRLSNVQKMALSALVVALVIGVGLATWFANDREMVPLYTNVDDAQAGRITDDLKQRGIEFEIGQGGTAILVPADEVYALRLDLASSGISGVASVGYELIDQNQFFGMPEDVVELSKKRMLEGELARSIATITAVSGARVHLAYPKKTLFVDEQRPTTASVIVNLERGTTMTGHQIKGIINLVSGAVSGLDPQNVTVIDQRGKVLNRAHEDSIDGGSALDYQRTIERELENKAAEVIERIVGEGRVIVRVRANMDFSREERTEELFDPERQVVRSEESLNEVRENGGNRVGGAAGADPNNPNVAQGVIRVGDASNSNREKVITTDDINKVVKRVVGPSARVKRLSIAVIVDGSYKAKAVAEGDEEGDEGAVAVKEYVPRTEDEMETIRRLVAKAVEFDEDRGDQLEVANVQFTDEDMAAAEAAIEAAHQRDAMRFWTRMGLVLVVALLLVFLVFRPMVRTLTEQPSVATVLDGRLPGGDRAALPGEELFEDLEYDTIPVAEQLVAYCRSNPQTAADVMSYWLTLNVKATSEEEAA
jgi:flagellar M-ring protein FliF